MNSEIDAVTKGTLIFIIGLFVGIMWILLLPVELIRIVFGKGNLKRYFLEYVALLKIL